VFEIGIRSHFSAAHHLEGYRGNCAEFHGHNWEVEVFVRGGELDASGMLMDYRALKEHVRAALAPVDHRDLNRVPELRGINPTSENIARYLFRSLAERLRGLPCRVSKVAVHETPGTVAYYSED
jgi:6-pyruvoyltetrahydropterin/6-carboxytetrahydropterin synthase